MARNLPLLMMLTGAVTALTAGAAVAQGVGIDHGALESVFNEPVTVSATGKPQRASDVPATMEIVTAEQIRRTGAIDIPGVLRDVVGVDVISTSLNSSDVSIRGYNTGPSRRVLVLLNGRQVYQDFYGMVQWSLIPVQLDEIRQIEVVKGPASALYGFNAVGGVINIVTYSPLYDNTNSVRVGIGNQGQRQGSAVVTVKPSESTGLRLSTGGFWAQDDGPDKGGYADWVRAPAHQRTLLVDSLSRLGDEVELGFEGSYAAGPERRLTDMTPVELDTTALSGKMTLSANTGIGLVNGQVYLNNFDWTGRIPNRPSFPVNNSATVASLQDIFKIGTNDDFRLSLEYRLDQASTANTGMGGLEYSVYSTGAMWDHAFGDGWSWNNSVRFDYLDLSHTGSMYPGTPIPPDAFTRTIEGGTFNSGLVYHATPVDSVRALVGRGMQLPNLGDLGALQFIQPTNPHDDGYVDNFGAPWLKPVTVNNYELSYDRRLPERDTDLRASVFYQTNSDIISLQGTEVHFDPVTNRLYEFESNVGDSDSVGVELGAKGRVGEHWNWALNYTWQRIWDINRPPQDITHPLPVLSLGTETPHHKVNARIGYTDGPLELDFGVDYRSKIAMANVDYFTPNVQYDVVPDVWLLTPRIGYKVRDDITAEVTAFGLLPRREALYSTLGSSVLFSVIKRW